jgi:hypothetical protein
MKLGILVGATMLVSAALAPAHAAGEHWFGIELGASVPHGYFSDDAETGTLVGLNYTHMVNDFVGLGVEIKRHGWKASEVLDAEAEATYGTGSRYLHTAWQYSAHGLFTMPVPGPVQVYAIGGTGFYNPGARLETPSGTFSDTGSEFGFHGGGGVRVKGPSNSAVDAFVTFHQFQTEPLSTAWTTAGIRVSWLLPNLDGGLGF